MNSNDFGHVGRNLLEAVQKGEFEEAFGRDAEITAAVDALDGKGDASPRNVLLVGPAGSGKTRVMHSVVLAWFARRQTEGTRLQCFEANSAALNVSTVRVIELMQSLLESVMSHPRNLLVVDGVAGLLDEPPSRSTPKGIVGPLIRDGKIRTVGTLNESEWARMETAAPAWCSNFQVIRLVPFTPEASIHALKKLRPWLQAKHEVSVSNAALEAAVRYSETYLPKMALPGKAIEVLDRACARFKQKHMARHRSGQWVDDTSMLHLGEAVEPHDIKRVVEEIAAVDIESSETASWSARLEERLRARVIGQSLALQRIAAFMADVRSRFGTSGRPAGSLLLCGPRGAGKAHAAKTLARRITGSADDILVLDMANFAGKGQGNALFDGQGQTDPNGARGSIASMLRPSTMAFLILDGIEQADFSVVEAICPALFRGKAPAGDGTELSFRRCVIVFTLNTDLSPQAMQTAETIKTHLTQYIPGPVLDAIDAIVPFSPLQREHIRDVVRVAAERFCQELKTHQIKIRIHDSGYQAIEALVWKDGNRVDGLAQVLDEGLFHEITLAIRAGRVESGSIIDIAAKDGQLGYRANFVTQSMFDATP